MSITQNDAVADLQRANTTLQQQLDEYRAERDAALAREAALAEVLEVINRSPGDPGPVFDAILERAHRLCGAAVGALMTYDGKNFRAMATQGYPEQYDASVRRSLSPNNYHRALIRGERFVHIPDVRADDIGGEADIARVFFGSTQLRAMLMVPLRRNGALLGFISAFRQEVRPYSDTEIGLLGNFAAQATIAMENARLLSEQREALEQQTATAEVLEVINASPGDLTPVFDTILEKAMRLCGAAFSALFVPDGDIVRLVRSRNVPSDYKAYFERQPPRLDADLLLSRAMREQTVLNVADLRETSPFRDRISHSVAAVELGGIRSICWVPLTHGTTALGLFAIFRQEVRPFTDKQIALLENFAAQAVIAMENARLITEQREALEQQTATAEVLQVINSSPGNLAPVFDAMLEKAMRLCEAALGALFVSDGEVVRLARSRNVPPDFKAYLEREPPRLDAGSLLSRAMREQTVLNVADLRETPPFRDGVSLSVAAVELAGIRSICWVPLIHETTALGLFAIFRQEVRPFSDKQMALLQNFAAQAVIAMENARLITEQREALEQQTANAEVLQVINASPGNLAPVFDAMLEKALRLCGGTLGGIFIFVDGHSVTSALRGVTAAFTEYNEKYPMDEIQPGTMPARIIETRRPAQYPDVTTGEAYRKGHPYARALVELGNIRAVLAVPLLKDGIAVGMFAVYRQEVGTFKDAQIGLLENFAAQAVIAMENARLITEQREALEQQTATAEVLQVVNASPGNLGPVFDAALEKAMRLCGAAFGSFYIYDGEQFHSAAQRGVPESYAEFRANDPPSPLPGSAFARAVETRRTLQNLDLKVDKLYLDGNPGVRAMVELGGIRTILAVPLCKDEAVLGLITVYRQEVRAFSEKQIALLENFAAQAVIAMENARLLHELRARTDELAQRQAELRVTFENMGDGVAMFDETHHLIAWNRKFQEIFNVPDALLEEHRTFADYIRFLAERGDYGPDVDPEDQVRHLAENAFQQHAYERTRPDGRVIEIRHNPVAGGGFVLIFSDITERKRNETEIHAARDAAETAYRELKSTQANLIQAEKMASLGQLTAGIAHEIKNPLNFVNNFSILSVELLNELKQVVDPVLPALDKDMQAEVGEIVGMLTSNLEKITEHGQRADGIVRSMLEHSRGGSGDRRRIDLNTLVEEALNLAYHGARAQDQSFNITLRRDLAEAIAPIDVVPQDVTRVLLNLFSNGFYAAHKRQVSETVSTFEPTLEVTTRDLGDAVEIRVRDNGIGIPVGIRDKLFQPFFTTKPTGEGTGLGLSISYDIVTQQHGGAITVDSKVGEYSEFTIRLPRGR